nr:nuclear transport factor 2 family protein [Maribacter vaceletii]
MCLGMFYSFSQTKKKQINALVTAWHQAAADANFDAYFGKMTNDAVFVGTDATENWQNKEFKEFCKPYFNNGKAWSFTTIERNIYSTEKNIAWFDELLNTQMGICRGSGVVNKVGGQWKIAHYVLSITIPNEKIKEVVLLKKVEKTALEHK